MTTLGVSEQVETLLCSCFKRTARYRKGRSKDSCYPMFLSPCFQRCSAGGIKASPSSSGSATGTATTQDRQTAHWHIHKRVKAAPHKSRQQG